MVANEHKAKSRQLFTTLQKFQKSPMWGLATCKNMDLAWLGNRILVPKSPFKSRTVLDGFQDESPKKLDPME